MLVLKVESYFADPSSRRPVKRKGIYRKKSCLKKVAALSHVSSKVGVLDREMVKRIFEVLFVVRDFAV